MVVHFYERGTTRDVLPRRVREERSCQKTCVYTRVEGGSSEVLLWVTCWTVTLDSDVWYKVTFYICVLIRREVPLTDSGDVCGPGRTGPRGTDITHKRQEEGHVDDSRWFRICLCD